MMTLTMRHIAGLVFAVVLTLLLYWIWQDGLTMVQRMLRMSPNLRALWGEFSTLIAFFLVCFVCFCLFVGYVSRDLKRA